MKRCWLADKQRPTMKEIVKVVEGWDTTRWERDVLTDAECTMTVCACLLQTGKDRTSVYCWLLSSDREKVLCVTDTWYHSTLEMA